MASQLARAPGKLVLLMGLTFCVRRLPYRDVWFVVESRKGRATTLEKYSVCSGFQVQSLATYIKGSQMAGEVTTAGLGRQMALPSKRVLHCHRTSGHSDSPG